jgi:hypothetical protein
MPYFKKHNKNDIFSEKDILSEFRYRIQTHRIQTQNSDAQKYLGFRQDQDQPNLPKTDF